MDFPKLDAAIAAGVYTLWERDTKSMIRDAERVLGVTLPPSFREFSLQYGQISVGDACLGGARIAQHSTPIARREHGLPEHFIVFQMEDGDVAMWALDTSRPRRDGEYPVVLIDFSEGGALSYDEYVEMHHGQPARDLAPDFHTFVERSGESSQRAHAKYAAIAKRSAAARKGIARKKRTAKAVKKTKTSKKPSTNQRGKVVRRKAAKKKAKTASGSR